jgi:MGT family glycosyltransferase
MATVCMIGHPASGHINPTLPVAAELVQRGERVFYYATPPFRDKIEQTGAIFRSLGEQAGFERNLARGGVLGGMAGLLETTELLLPELLRQVEEDAPDYLLVEAHALWGNLLAQRLGSELGLPAIALCSMFAMNEGMISAGSLLEYLYHSAEAAWEGLLQLNKYFALARTIDRCYHTRCPGVIGYLGNPQALNIVFTSREFQVRGEAFDASYKFVGPASGIRMEGVATLAEFDAAGLRGPVILIAMGTMYNEEIDLYRECFAAFGDSPYTVVMAIGHRVDPTVLGVPPSNFVVRSYVPQLEVLDRAVLFITHGGINSAHEAMLYGVPMVVLPAAADHFVIADRVEAVGSGVVLHRTAASAERLRSCVERVLDDPSYKENSRRMGVALREAGGASRAADEILAFVNTSPRTEEMDHVRV